METYLVGGAVRDELLGIEVTERDYVVVGASEKEMLDAGFRPVGKDFPVYLHPVTGEEYALARTERRTGRGHRAFECNTESVSLEEDLTRRDLTVNAIARDSNGSLIDPLGGIEDLERKQLRHISGAFAEDPLRILRVARFAARLSPLGFVVADETMTLMAAMVADGELTDLTPERVLLELDKAMAADAPAVFFEVIEHVGGASVLWPELNGDALGLLRRVTQLTDQTHFRLVAALVATSVDDALAIARRYRFPNRTSELLRQHRLFAGIFARIDDESDVTPERLVDMLYQLDAFRQAERFAELVNLTTLLSRASGDDEGKAEAQRQRWISIQRELAAISRSDVDPNLHGPSIGEAIRAERIRRLSA